MNTIASTIANTGIKRTIKRAAVRVSIIALCAACCWPLPQLLAGEVDDLNAKIIELNQEGRYPEASAVAGQAAEKAKTLHGELSTQYARAISWQAYLLQARGRSDQAESLFEKSLDIYQKILPPDHPDIATSINNLGFSYQNSDRLIEAEQMYKRALEMREKAKPVDELRIADSLNNLAQCYKRQGRVDEALPLLLRAFEIRKTLLGEKDPFIAQSLTNIGSALELQEKFADAEPYFRKALEIRRASQPADHPDVAGSMNKLAEILFKRGHYAEAERIFRDVIELRYKTQPPGHIDIATSLTAQAQNLIELKQYGEAKSALRTALTIQQAVLPPLHPAIALSQAELGRIARLEGDNEQALRLLRVATVSQAARGRYDDLARQHFANFVSIASAMQAKAAGATRSTLDNEALEMAQRSSLTDTAATVTRMAARFSSNDPALRDLMRDREEVEAETQRREKELSAILALPAAERGNAADETRNRLIALSGERSRLDADLKHRFPGYANLTSPDPLSVADVQSLLSNDEVVVYYFCGLDGLYAWAISKDSATFKKLEPDIATLARTVMQVRNTLDVSTILRQGTSAKLFELDTAHKLYTWLLGPLEGATQGKTNMIVVPSGPLTSLPFQTLVKSKPTVAKPVLTQLTVYRDADWLMNHYALSVVPALSSLKAIRATARRPEGNKPMVGFGNPVFEANAKATPPPAPAPQPTAQPASASAVPAPLPADSAPAAKPLSYASFWRGPAADADALRQGLPPLPETETELRFVADRLKAVPTDLHMGMEATEAAVKTSDLTQYRVVYFATHGLVAGEIKGLGEPALALTLPAKPTDLDDGLLTASEVSQLKLNADWVILSACNTADPGAAGAEALSGLARSFFHAGARALLVSHWRVGSQATTRITTMVFDLMAKNPTMGRAEALREAMRAFLADKSDPWNAYPTFWAPFVVVGDTRPDPV